jgi:hypothetical protein
MSQGMNRREFLRTSAGGVLVATSLRVFALPDAASATSPKKPEKPTLTKPKVPTVYRDGNGKAHSRAYLGVYSGSAVAGLSRPESLETLVGRRFAINHCFRQPPEAPWAPLRIRFINDRKAGRIPMLSYAAGETPGIADHDAAALQRLREIVRGQRDVQIDAQARELAALKTPVFFRFTWEFDLRYPTAEGIRLHKAAWRRVHKRFAIAGASNVAFVWCPSYQAFGNGKAAAFYPGDTYVDWVGVDGYARTPDYKSFYSLFARASTWAVAHKKPVMVCETGVHRLAAQSQLTAGSTAQSTWLDALRSDFSADRFSNVKALLYFHVDGDNNPLPDQWRLTSPLDGPAFSSFKSLSYHPRLKASRRTD